MHRLISEGPLALEKTEEGTANTKENQNPCRKQKQKLLILGKMERLHSAVQKKKNAENLSSLGKNGK